MLLEDQVQTTDSLNDLDSSEPSATPEQDYGQYDGKTKLSDKIASGEINPQVTELDKLQRFRFQGKDWDPKSLKSALMRQSDYTQKTQSLAEERKQIEEDRKFIQALKYDLPKIKANPALAEEFKKLYPESYHDYLSLVQEQAEKKQEQQQQAEQRQVEQKISDPRLDEVYNFYKEQAVRASEVEINSIFDKMNDKYPMANENDVISSAQLAIEKHKQDPRNNPKPDSKWYEQQFERSHKRFESLAEKYNQQKTQKLKDANVRGKSPGPGGQIPGMAPVQPRNLKEASRLMWQELEK